MNKLFIMRNGNGFYIYQNGTICSARCTSIIYAVGWKQTGRSEFIKSLIKKYQNYLYW